MNKKHLDQQYIIFLQTDICGVTRSLGVRCMNACFSNVCKRAEHLLKKLCIYLTILRNCVESGSSAELCEKNLY
jgi:hypothetical protein